MYPYPSTLFYITFSFNSYKHPFFLSPVLGEHFEDPEVANRTGSALLSVSDYRWSSIHALPTGDTP